jgi:thioredoxin 1
MAHQVTDASFAEDALQADLPVLVDFWAPWCGPCRAVGPVVEELAADFAGRLSVMKMNVDDNPLTAEKYGIRAIPTLIVFRRGEVVDQVTGAVSKASLVEVIEKALA